eukprot:m.194553 g.194553  ORF g.194553 m.194553 type:complete len:53 (-) comp53707_c0_seq14:1888-2046(-)
MEDIVPRLNMRALGITPNPANQVYRAAKPPTPAQNPSMSPRARVSPFRNSWV